MPADAFTLFLKWALASIIVCFIVMGLMTLGCER